MNIYELMEKRRTIRKFKNQPIEHGLLEKFVEYARLAPTGANKQPIKYMIIDDDRITDVFKQTHWAGALKGKGTPTMDEKPVAFILLLNDKNISAVVSKHDIGASAQSIQLMALEEGIGTCWMGAIDRKRITEICSIPDYLELDTLISLGYPLEDPMFEPLKGDNTNYYKDEDGRLHVPKRGLDEVLVK